MTQPEPIDEFLTPTQVEERFGIKRSALYRYIRRGDLPSYGRAMDRHVYVRRADIETLRRFRRNELVGKLTAPAVERARAFQHRVFGERQLTTPSDELIAEVRQERADELP